MSPKGQWKKEAQMSAVRYLQCKTFIVQRNKQYKKANVARGSWGAGFSPLCKPFFSKQSTTGDDNAMTNW